MYCWQVSDISGAFYIINQGCFQCVSKAKRAAVEGSRTFCLIVLSKVIKSCDVINFKLKEKHVARV